MVRPSLLLSACLLVAVPGLAKAGRGRLPLLQLQGAAGNGERVRLPGWACGPVAVKRRTRDTVGS